MMGTASGGSDVRRKSDENRILSQESNLSQGSGNFGNMGGQLGAAQNNQMGAQNNSNPSPSPQNTMLPAGNHNQNYTFNQQNNPNLTRLLGNNSSQNNNNFQR